MFANISDKRKYEQFQKVIKEANKIKEENQKQKQLALLKSQIARGIKNVALLEVEAENDKGGEKMDVQQMIAEEHRRAQNHRMEQIVTGILSLSEKSEIEVSNIEGIKEFIKYQYPVLPSTDENGDNIYGEISSKIDSKWETGELSDLKYRSKSKMTSLSRWRAQDSINI